MRAMIGRAGGMLAAALVGLMALTGAAMAQQEGQTALGAPVPWAMGLQASGGPVKDAISQFNSLVFWIIVAITIFVALLLAYCLWRFSESRNPVPSQTAHNTPLEIAWTVIPVLILIVIAIPSFRLIYYQDRPREVDLTINVTGHQWYWSYRFPDHGGFAFDSRPLADDELKPGQLRNLDVDEPLVIPTGRNIRIITNGADVIHSFFVPSLGTQKYTIPGRALETWFRADRAGTYYGQCNQICGVNHWFMPIMIKAVPPAEFEVWVADARRRFAATMPNPPAPALAGSAPDTTLVADARR
jgi:cytochrome c oxidase subunit 2